MRAAGQSGRYQIDVVQPGDGGNEMVQRVLGESFEHWLMSDEYGVYREYTWRLRCLAHIIRKARGLEESLGRDARLLADLFTACIAQADSKHEKMGALVCELLNGWDTFWFVFDHPELPLTNKAAERALRHWVIARRISHGTCTPHGIHAFSLLASVIETCRQRAVSPWPYLADVVRQRRKGLPALALPLPAN